MFWVSVSIMSGVDLLFVCLRCTMLRLISLRWLHTERPHGVLFRSYSLNIYFHPLVVHYLSIIYYSFIHTTNILEFSYVPGAVLSTKDKKSNRASYVLRELIALCEIKDINQQSHFHAIGVGWLHCGNWDKRHLVTFPFWYSN